MNIREELLLENHNPSRLSKRKPVSAERRRNDAEVQHLLLQYRQTGRSALRDRIVSQYANLVESVARRFSGAAEPVEDLIQEGYIGLITAIDLYDPAKNVKFSTYATHFIIGQIKHCLRDRGKIIKEPAWLQELNQRMTRVIESLAQQLSRPPTNEEIAQMMDMTEEAVAEMMMTREVFKVSSIDGGSDSDDDSGGTVDMERKQGKDIGVSFQLSVEDRIVLETAMLKLKELEQKVLAEFYFKDLNQTEIARQMGISCNYVSHILRNSTKKLKKILVTDELRNVQLRAAQARARRDEQQAEAEQIPIVDELTRCYNRRYYETRLQEELSRASREGDEAAVLFVKVGGLDVFIRQYGTLKGDEAVTELAVLIARQVRRSDIVTRYSTDEFALILPRTGRIAQLVRSRLILAIETWLGDKGWNGGRAPLVIGTGMALYPRDAVHALPLTMTASEQSVMEQALVVLPRAA